MTDLVEFLRARLDEDERAAQAACVQGDLTINFKSDDGEVGDEVLLTHIGRWDPVRVLAEVEAKRRIIDEHTIIDPCDAHDASLRSIPCPTLELLALPYAGHPDYDPEWAVTTDASTG